MSNRFTLSIHPVDGSYSASFQNSSFFEARGSFEHGICREVGSINFITPDNSTEIAKDICKDVKGGCQGTYNSLLIF